MKIAIASDHGGYELKEKIKEHFANWEWEDLGTYSTGSVDYPDYGFKLAKAIEQKKYEKGIIICGTGIGISIAANRCKNVRAALCHNAYTAEMARRHNDANVLALGGRVLDPKTAFEIVEIFFRTPFDGGRHERRVQKLSSESCR
ncbi:MAG: ribose 5-phosphate isomerase B [Candidatus Hydrogenedentota bacterium]|nr:MAG: ribose 5-phosphate isomerase B [Candidatus Hydrogenedentota bacterium]